VKKLNKKILIFVIIFVISILYLFNYIKNKENDENSKEDNSQIEELNDSNIINTTEKNEDSKYSKKDFKIEESDKSSENIEKIEIQDIDGKNYTFDYKGETFSAIYTTDNWKIIDSYRIKDKNDITTICEALIDIHPIHGADMVTYRTATDMAFEWLQHNLAYEILPEGNSWRRNAKDVDLNPEDQYRTLAEMYEARTGKKLY